MQGISHSFLPKESCVHSIFVESRLDSIDFGSFVSPKAIPQMQDTAAVLSQLIYRKQK
jgi:hydroxymethylglutaryl-CoA lyase